MSYVKTTWVNGSAPPINATNLNKIEEGIEQATPLIGFLSVGTTTFTTSSLAGFPVKAEITISNVTTLDVPFINFTTSSYLIAEDAGIKLAETYAGGVILYAENTPSNTVSFDYVIVKG